MAAGQVPPVDPDPAALRLQGVVRRLPLHLLIHRVEAFFERLTHQTANEGACRTRLSIRPGVRGQRTTPKSNAAVGPVRRPRGTIIMPVRIRKPRKSSS